MDRELIGQLDTQVTRRTVVKTGAKLAYAVPLVAASFKLDNGVGAQAPSPTCAAGNCDKPSICGEACGCRTVANGSTTCLQNIACIAAVPCDNGSCPAGSTCLVDTCCPKDRFPVPLCVPTCARATAGFLTNSTSASEGLEGEGPWVLGKF